MQTTRIDVILTIPDARAKGMMRDFKSHGAKSITDVVIVDSYITDIPLLPHEVTKVVSSLTNPHIERGFANGKILAKPFSVAIEIAYLAGVTDNVGTTTQETIFDVIGEKKDGIVSSARVYVLYGDITDEALSKIKKSLHNPLIERATIVTWKDYMSGNGFSKKVTRVSLYSNAKADKVSLDVSPDELQKIGTLGIASTDGVRRGPLALSLKDMETIRDYFKGEGRSPTDIEIESIAQTWSEHCKHRIFASPMEGIPDGIYKNYIKRATVEIRKAKGKKDFCRSVFSDNSGIIDFDKNWLVTHKVETHNSPSALDPFGGAITGVVGVNRDAIGTGLGAKPVANMYGFCVGNPTDDRPLYRDAKCSEQMLLPRRILDGVVRGINVGGNSSGIPTPHGFLLTEDRFRGKPLVFAGTVGLLPRKVLGKPSWEKSASAGEYIVSVGNRVGLDGIHGATFSSVALDSGSPATAVQIGDPITQKKFSDAIVKEARDLGLYTSITDNGAGGISCAVAEMAREAGGCAVDLEKVPVKYSGLAPWQIWISESQERITLSVPKSKWNKLEALCKSRGVEATVIGEFTKSGRAVVSWENNVLMDLSLEFLHNGWPREELLVKKGEHSPTPISPKKFGNPEKELLSLLSRPSISSHAYIAEQYDHEVQGSSVLKPIVGRGRVPSPTAVIKPVLRSPFGVLMTSALYPTYGDGDTYNMTSSAIDTAVRQSLVGGASLDAIAILDNFCWSKSDTPESLYELREAGRACYETAVIYGTPFISGKDSMHNDFRGYDKDGKPVAISIPPTILISAIAVMPNALDAVSLDFKKAGDYIFVIGDTHDEFGGTHYGAMVGGVTKNVPKTDAKKWSTLYKKYSRARKYTSAGFAVSHGGLGVALAKMSIGGKLGCTADIGKLSGTWTSPQGALFSESQGRIVCTVSSKNKSAFQKIMGKNCILLGRVTDDEKIVITQNKKKIIETSVEKLAGAFNKTFKGY
ncbi:MAG: phosphoribosylformylglycinamidine synthase [Candidatus Pacebacteria bacterium]|nr:phosphoribosylformylglycinamidine synthase [Candidatus Paceibacterota bacterium]